MAFWGRPSRETTPSPNPYTQVPPDPYSQPRSARGLPPNPQSSQYRQPPSGYNDPSAALFDGRRSDQRQSDPRMASYDQRQYSEKPLPRRDLQTSGKRQFEVANAPNDRLALSNRAIVHRNDLPTGQHITIACPGNNQIFTTLHDNSPPTDSKQIMPGQIGLSAVQRQWLGVAVGDPVNVEEVSGRSGLAYLQSFGLVVDFNRRGGEAADPFSADDMTVALVSRFNNMVVSEGQSLIFEFRGYVLKGKVESINTAELSEGTMSHCGIIMEKTDIDITKEQNSKIQMIGSAKKPVPNAILKPNFKFQDMGIGGLDTEFNDIFRRAFASRVFPPGLVAKLGIQHVKGILLHGPPGTGKTLIARQIGKVLNAKEPKIVNGPEILNKYVGASEENIRNLFSDAEKEYKAKGDESGLHIIIFDELDAIFKQRGSTNSGTGVGDSVVNQLLSKMDGVDQLNNILIIGMTNRKDMIDEALLRPGRLEVHMEISLPDEKGRQQILNIHTQQMRTNGVMEDDVDIAELAGLTKNFSGAEIAGLIKDATSFAFSRHIKVGTMAGVSDDVENLKVNRDDFIRALEEVRPAFGVAEEELQQVIQNGIIHYSKQVEDILRAGELFVQQVRTSTRTPLVSILLHGKPGAGKSALAASIAQASEFPFIKLISPDTMVGFGESQKISAITRVFMDSYKSPLSVVVVDNIERLIDWTPLNARFSNAVLQTLLVLFARRPPKGRRLLVIATSSIHPVLGKLGVADVFDSQHEVGLIHTLEPLERVLREVELFESNSALYAAIQALRESQFEGQGNLRRSIGIKKLLSTIEMARQEPENVAERLVTSLLDLRLEPPEDDKLGIATFNI